MRLLEGQIEFGFELIRVLPVWKDRGNDTGVFAINILRCTAFADWQPFKRCIMIWALTVPGRRSGHLSKSAVSISNRRNQHSAFAIVEAEAILEFVDYSKPVLVIE